MKLRGHQKEIGEIAQRIRNTGKIPEMIIAHVVPGGGKSRIPIILSEILIPDVVSHVCIVVPRRNLMEQIEGEFIRFSKNGLTVRASTNDIDPSRRCNGYVTTYQALQSDRATRINAMEFDRLDRKYLLILDEFHHADDDGVYLQSIQPLIERATMVVGMTGTLERGDRGRISMLPYKEVRPGEFDVDFESKDGFEWINYGIQKATEEKAIVRACFQHIDGSASWVQNGEKITTKSFSDNDDSLGVALQTQFSNQLLDRCLKNFLGFRGYCEWAQMLVVCSNIDQAKKTLCRLKEIDAPRSEIVHTYEKKSLGIIREFRAGRFPILVSVAMAYEGLDVRSISHLACLTNYRSKPWIEQMIARAWRADTENNKTDCWIYTPDDPAMLEIIKRIEDEQRLPIHEHSGSPLPPPGTGEAKLPLGSEATTERSADLGGEKLDTDETKNIENAMRESMIFNVSAATMKSFLRSYEMKSGKKDTNQDDKSDSITPSMEEDMLRKAIQKYLARWVAKKARELGCDPNWQEPNDILLREGWSPRSMASVEELRKLFTYIQSRFPI